VAEHYLFGTDASLEKENLHGEIADAPKNYLWMPLRGDIVRVTKDAIAKFEKLGDNVRGTA
jgi:hypothetical protein